MEPINRLFRKFEQLPAVRAVRDGLVMIIPMLMVGSSILVLKYFPITAYQVFINNVFSGNLLLLLNLVYDATFGMLSVYLTLTVSFSYTRQRVNTNHFLTPALTALLCFLVLSGISTATPTMDPFGPKGMFVAILCGTLATKCFFIISSENSGKSQRRVIHHRYTDGTDVGFNRAVSAIIPSTIVVFVFAAVNLTLIKLFHAASFFDLFVKTANALFLPLERSFAAGLLMVLVSSILWFFGIHGSNVLESVMANLFTPAVQDNIALVRAGKAPTEILTKEFFDVFVLMGGCGTAICLLLSLLLFSKRRSNRRLSRLAAAPMLFNINELMIFGLPVIFNISLIVPFILTPLFSFFTTYGAMRLGIVPMITAEVNWTAPVLISGYTATASIAGSLLQLFNMVAGIFIYRPFILAYDKKRDAAARRQLQELVDLLKESENTLTPITLIDLTDEHGGIARSIAADLKYALSRHELQLYYQPQYNDNTECNGIEALLRWRHPLYGLIYPPLIIQLARETDFLTELETWVLHHALNDLATIQEKTGYSQEISVNVCAATLMSDAYFDDLITIKSDPAYTDMNICLEITEQTALHADDSVFARLQEIKALGFALAIDDFSMGHTSLTYLQENQFDTVKLDGSLVRSMIHNPRSLDIIKSITSLSKRLGFSVIAEFVEEQEQLKMLKKAGCLCYQGYLFSPALPVADLILRFQSEKAVKSISTEQSDK